MIVLRDKITAERIVYYYILDYIGQAFFTKSIQNWKLPYVLPGVVGRSLPSGGGITEDIDFI